ncbi:MAG: Lrp/AsnC family transcriptional regulator [Desulfurococcales archaeon]|nr:Lrp/AsnC family transcriptional regulator [Desulfurococcales archaeon]
MISLSASDVRLLNELQYNFPLSRTPYQDISIRLGIQVNQLLSSLRKFKSLGVIKRIGFYLNYRAKNQQAALIALSTKGNYSEISSYLARDAYTSHAYIRDHPLFDLWIVSKRKSRDELIGFIKHLANEYHVKDWVILFGVKTWKLSVKYDLVNGISRSNGKYVNPPDNIPTLQEHELVLAEKLKSLPLEVQPYSVVSRLFGLSEETVYNRMLALTRKGVLGDPGASLDGRKLGFVENGMLTMTPYSDYSDLCECLARNEYTTHVVQREAYPPGSFEMGCYAMIHAVNRGKLEFLRDRILSQCHPHKWLLIRSIEDLKPGTIR